MNFSRFLFAFSDCGAVKNSLSFMSFGWRFEIYGQCMSSA